MSNLIDIEKIVDEIEEWGRKCLANALTVPVDDVSPVVSPKTEGVSPVVESTGAERRMGEVLKVATLIEDGGKVRPGNSRRCRQKDSVGVMIRKRKGVCRDEPIELDAPEDSDAGVVDADVVSDSKPIASEANSSYRRIGPRNDMRH